MMAELELLIQTGKTEQSKLNPKYTQKDLDKKLSPLTLKQYTTTINKLYRELGIKKEITNLLWLEQYKEDIKNYISSLNTPNTRKTYLSVVITLLNNDANKYKELIKYYANISSENYDNIKIQTKKDKSCNDERIITLEDYDKFITHMSKNKQHSKEYIMFLILRHYPIRNEIGTFIYIKNNDFVKLDISIIKEHNWIVEKSKSIEMIRYKFKTARFYAEYLPYVNVIEQPLKAVFKKYIKDNDIQSNTPIFNLTENQVSHRLAHISNTILPQINTKNDVSGIKLSTSLIFKILACDAVKNNSNDEARKILTHYGNIRGTKINEIIAYYVNGKAIDNMSDISDD
jgi:hypothetical protein